MKHGCRIDSSRKCDANILSSIDCWNIVVVFYNRTCGTWWFKFYLLLEWRKKNVFCKPQYCHRRHTIILRNFPKHIHHRMVKCQSSLGKSPPVFSPKSIELVVHEITNISLLFNLHCRIFISYHGRISSGATKLRSSEEFMGMK